MISKAPNKIKAQDAFDKNGKFQPNSLAVHVSEGVAVGPDGSLWSYQGGVFRPDPDVIDRRVARVLRNDYTIARGSVVERLVRYMPLTKHLTAEEPEPWCPLINLRNGVYLWRETDAAERFASHDPVHRSMIQLPFEYDAGATCPNFDAWLYSVLPEEVHGLLWESLGYLLMTGNPLQTAFLLLGREGTGKSTFLRVLEKMLGRENISAESLKSLTENRFAASSLYGKAANIVGDIDSSYMDDTSLFLQITGGDTMSHERKGKDAFPFRPFAVPVFSTNKVWQSANTSGAYFRRWTILPFDIQVDRSKPFDEAALHAEVPGIFNKAMNALRALYYRTEPKQVFDANGRPTDEVIQEPARYFEIVGAASEARERFARESDPIREWMDADELVYADAGNASYRVPRSTLYARYAAWCDQNNVGAKSGPKFYTAIRNLGYREFKSNGVMTFEGVYVYVPSMVGVA
ncbi:phage/plasmid primase, P4 family [Microbacterium sp. H6]|uniref:DNA primase family protein n=1 Tax=Microbacterium sp. H6 TaxID=421122 RepID=UPI000DE5665E|nr:DNA primase family protein [Microbacterium sp. H6]RBO70530.1 hypothetical protein DSP71_21455 [Microbacterium sp. H6]